jgi:hypothetical protein
MTRWLGLLLFAIGCGGKDADGDGFAGSDDCDDEDAAVNANADELCDSVDNDCDGEVDEEALDASAWYIDGDGDGYGDLAGEALHCAPPIGFVTDPTDCDDGDAGVHPTAVEVCDGIDQDCDGTADDGAGIDYYEDLDGDGFGDPSTGQPLCDGTGFVGNGTDCDDTVSGVHPGALEICDEIDNDCDELVDDDDDDLSATLWYLDDDGDAYGDDAVTVVACAPVGTWATVGGDCDDSASTTNPGAPEVCGGGDEDCDGLDDNDDPDVSDADSYAPDLDGDGFGATGAWYLSCFPPSDASLVDGDCDDADSAVFPGAPEVCGSGVDADCDGLLADDDPDAAGAAYVDADGDSWGTTLAPITGCDPPAGYAARDGDCDDGRPAVNPGAAEVCFNDLDDDCDTLPGACRLTGEVDAATDAWLVVYGATGDGLGYPFTDPTDLDGDGAFDLVLGAPGVPWIGGGTEGGLYAAFGPVAGGTTTAAAVADHALTGQVTDDMTGQAQVVLDLDRDGRLDLVVGVPGAGTGGELWIYLDTPTLPAALTRANADTIITTTVADAFLGYTLATGDLDGDGRDDLIVGAPGDLRGAGITQVGSAYAVFTGALPAGSTTITAQADLTVNGTVASGHFGTSVAAGDVDGDGQDDLVVGGPGSHWWLASYSYAGAAYVWSGPVSGTTTDTTADLKITGVDVSDAVGVFVAVPGDLDGDGVDELVIGASGDTTGGTDSGKLGVFWGPVGGGSDTIDGADVIVRGVSSFTYVGEGVGAGDLDGDGLDDLVVSSWAEGAWVFYGPPADGVWRVDDADLHVMTSGAAPAIPTFGSPSRPVGDLDGDGLADLLVCEPTDATGGNNAGAAYLIRGRSF